MLDISAVYKGNNNRNFFSLRKWTFFSVGKPEESPGGHGPIAPTLEYSLDAEASDIT